MTLLVLCGLMLIGAGSRVAANDPKDEKAVTATLEAMAKATIEGDVPTQPGEWIRKAIEEAR